MADGLDGTWANLTGTPVELRWPELGIRAEMRVGSPTLCIVAASPAGAAAVAVEPETHAPQGLRRLLRGEPDALTMLAPGWAIGAGHGARLRAVLMPRAEPSSGSVGEPTADACHEGATLSR